MTDFSVGIVGLDSLGEELGRRLEAQGIGNTVTDLNPRLLQAHLAGGGSAPAGSPYDLAQVCDLILLAETNDEALRESVLGSVGLIHALRPGTILIDMSEASPQVSAAMAGALYSKGTIWIEATPVGGVTEVRSGRMTLLTAGPAEELARIEPVLHAFAEKIIRLGELGAGPLAKALASAFGHLLIAAQTEMLIIGKRAGIDPARLLDAMPLLAPGLAGAVSVLRMQVLSGRYESDVSAKRLQEHIGRSLDAARAAAAPAFFLPLLQAASVAAGQARQATGNALDVARWIADNAGVDFDGAADGNGETQELETAPSL
jgi:3-hydroxyisobutyrate dehydrogenase-like beta-hydroxyacid dehydrogenase